MAYQTIAITGKQAWRLISAWPTRILHFEFSSLTGQRRLAVLQVMRLLNYAFDEHRASSGVLFPAASPFHALNRACRAAFFRVQGQNRV